LEFIYFLIGSIIVGILMRKFVL